MIPQCLATKRVRKGIIERYEAGILKDIHVKRFLVNYYDGNPNDMLKGNNKKALLEDYILIHEALVGDDLQVHEFETLYERHYENHCCGQMTCILPRGTEYCEVCGNEYTFDS